MRPEDLRNFAENLDINQFKALSPGLGIGDLRPKKRSRVEGVPAAKMPPQVANPMSPSAFQETQEQVSVAAHSVVNAGPTRPKRLPRLWLRLKASGLDLLMVGFAVCFALATAALAQGLKSGVTSEGWVDLGVFKWIRQFAYWQLGAMMVALYMGYIGLFRGILGLTPGENIAGCAKNRKDNLGYKANGVKAPL